MKNPILIFIGTVLVSASVSASGYAWRISADTTQFDYAETANGRLLDTETNEFGDIGGFSIGVDPLKHGFYADMSYAQGTTDYIGGTNLDPTYGSHRTTTDNRVSDFTAGYQWNADFDHGRLQMPFKVGVGYRAWLRQIQSTPTVSGYDELYEWGYTDIGIGLKSLVSDRMHLGVHFNYRNAFNATMYENWHGYTFHLKNVYGYKVTAPFEIDLDRSWSTFFMYTYEYWNIGASDPIGGYYEPDSETKNQTLSIGLRYKF